MDQFKILAIAAIGLGIIGLAAAVSAGHHRADPKLATIYLNSVQAAPHKDDDGLTADQRSLAYRMLGESGYDAVELWAAHPVPSPIGPLHVCQIGWIARHGDDTELTQGLICDNKTLLVESGQQK